MHIDKFTAINSLKPGAKFTAVGDVITWLDSENTQPSDSEINAELAKLQVLEARKKAYPTLGDFADAMYWNSKGDSSKLTAYYAACEKVKSDNPKP